MEWKTLHSKSKSGPSSLLGSLVSLLQVRPLCNQKTTTKNATTWSFHRYFTVGCLRCSGAGDQACLPEWPSGTRNTARKTESPMSHPCLVRAGKPLRSPSTAIMTYGTMTHHVSPENYHLKKKPSRPIATKKLSCHSQQIGMIGNAASREGRTKVLQSTIDVPTLPSTLLASDGAAPAHAICEEKALEKKPGV